MNLAYVVHSGEFTPVVATMLASLDQHCDCTLIFVVQGMTPALQQHVRSVFAQPIEFRAVPDEQWFGQRMARKIWELQHVSFSHDDRVFVLDTDLLIQADIFAGLDGSFDVGLTTRHYDYWYKINGGVWGFQFNARSRAFLKFFADELRCPTWAPLLAFQESFKRRRPPSAHRSLDWWCDQDFLCTAFDHPLPFACTIGDLGPRYNFCPSVEDDAPGTFEKARDEILAKLGDRAFKVQTDVMRTALQPVVASVHPTVPSAQQRREATHDAVGVDLHTRDQSIALLDTETGEARELRLRHEGDEVEQFYDSLARPVTVGIESTVYALWFHQVMHRLGHQVLVGDAAKIRATVVRRTKTDRATPAKCCSCCARIASPRSGCQTPAPVICGRSSLTASGSSAFGR